MNQVQTERLAELIESDADFGSMAARMIERNKERDRMRKTIGDLRELVLTLQVERMNERSG